MLLVVYSYLWIWVGCFTLLAGVWFTLSQPSPILAYIVAHLKRFFTVPSTANQQSTWPGEADMPLDDNSQTL